MEVPRDSIIRFAQSLIRIPSQGGIDSWVSVLNAVRAWFEENKIESRILQTTHGEQVGVLAEISGQQSGPAYCLNACLDTAPFGRVDDWDLAPTSGEIIDGWLYGRGSADCKTAVSIFSHLAVRLSRQADRVGGTISFLFDGDEHTGRFEGIKTYVAMHPGVAGVMIGYPGNDGIVVGARGFYRAKMTVFGTSTHSGTLAPVTENAIEKSALLVQRLSRTALPEENVPSFKFGPKLTVTAIRGGSGYSIIPDQCDVLIDIRLTPSVDKYKVASLVKNVVAQIDREFPTRLPTVVQEEESWPAYKLPDTSPITFALHTAAVKYSSHPISTIVCGPSNVGNYLAALGIDATCGYGVSCKNIHAPNECIDVSTIDMVYRTYLEAIRILLM